jgi:predicted DNA-binding transcriptional regulator AlpA
VRKLRELGRLTRSSAFEPPAPGGGAALIHIRLRSGSLVLPRSTVYDYAKRRADPLPSVQIGRHHCFHRSEVDRWPARRRA